MSQAILLYEFRLPEFEHVCFDIYKFEKTVMIATERIPLFGFPDVSGRQVVITMHVPFNVFA